MDFTSFPKFPILLILAPSLAWAACYFVDGTPGYSDQRPCDPSAEVSACCATFRPDYPDICLSSGLCYSYEGFLFMDGCTDKSGKANGCPQFCRDGKYDCVLLKDGILAAMDLGHLSFFRAHPDLSTSIDQLEWWTSSLQRPPMRTRPGHLLLSTVCG